jgi:hypothetical protein
MSLQTLLDLSLDLQQGTIKGSPITITNNIQLDYSPLDVAL